MTVYERMLSLNRLLYLGGRLSEEERGAAVCAFLLARSAAREAERFYIGVRYPGNTNPDGNRMYPEIYIPPYNGGKKYRTVTGQLPKTHILSANMYELEIIRLLVILEPNNEEVKKIAAKALLRLRTACFASADDGAGECFDSSAVTLRFLAAVSPQSENWIKDRIANYNRHFYEKPRERRLIWYFWLCLSELPPRIAAESALRYKKDMLESLAKFKSGPEPDFGGSGMFLSPVPAIKRTLAKLG